MTQTMKKRVVIMGQGYVGLPVAMRAVSVGFDVVGFDVDKDRVARLREGHSFIEDVSDDDLAAAVATGRYLATTDLADLAGFDIAVISVPTPLRDGAPDLTFVEVASEQLAGMLRTGACVILESTTYPGTTDELVVPRLENGSGLKAGVDFYVGYSPERIDPGNATYGFVNTPKIVAGINDASTEVVDEFYSALVDRTVRLPGTREAELSKLLENTFRHVNIALVNELAMYARELGIDVWSVIDAAATKPFGFMKFTPGPGVGGHCLPIDPSYLSWQVRRSLGHNFRFVELANDVNEHMPDYVVKRVGDRLNRERKSVNGSRILAMGISYKKNSGDARESPAITVIEHLVNLGAEIHAVDPWVEPSRFPPGVKPVELTAGELDEADLIVLLTDHDGTDYELLATYGHKLLDTRNKLRGPGVELL